MTDTISDAALEPCPFCGATPFDGPTTKKLIGQDGEPFQRYRVWCPHRHATVDEMNKEQAFRVWNRRASGSAVEARRVLARKLRTLAEAGECGKLSLEPSGCRILREAAATLTPTIAEDATEARRQALEEAAKSCEHGAEIGQRIANDPAQPLTERLFAAAQADADIHRATVIRTLSPSPAPAAEDATVAPQPAPVEAEPVAWIVYVKDTDNVILWTFQQERTESVLERYPGSRLVPVYAHPPKVTEAMVEALCNSVQRYETPVHDDIGMQPDTDGDWVRVSDLCRTAALTASLNRMGL